MTQFCLEVAGDFACFTRPEMKVERVSYDIITPSAARNVFQAILWKPEIDWCVRRIEVLRPIRWINLRRNEVGKTLSAVSVARVMKQGRGALGLYVEDERQQRAGLFLRDVAYRLHAELVVKPSAQAANPLAKYRDMFVRRAGRGQCVNQPYLGCREFAARFRLVDPGAEPADWCHLDAADRRELGFYGGRDLGWMLRDLDFTQPADPQPRFFRAELRDAAVEVPDWQEGRA
ncbi:type I-C CRISPR-associated protein Cas5c [Ralstonia pseudosolanacearum]|uniref:type I-C CRISPR-associated protein Cas5c n=1 Tax=Ralstonia pseudosolanacearum TaxID=1310165 RepID=UPI002675A7DD|nr:type I-C CRISPR-associated protein Cas5c [Ralstonia pseudosolanacearum]MDO3524432.1 type I-C CRISPR-associated protein Cas5c [Ralstonia pseudosolanacearum]MDO3548483.1 type I-C CRISPR-associated protein Cas5c [Ralstonia pseudosolanacearum]MDO3554071.1 type I-C CRISPR-associated protein Cas5c [Ralstonia pseudosolanacearum]MDO3558835.1 type I-C CRISPR-associated protein Cas5c [Ralstonia pseudosolanacearum]MDO3568574.1 type I-C CRISPR-associated protein Cas5c [Ralstonia pseudosolanacearum]